MSLYSYNSFLFIILGTLFLNFSWANPSLKTLASEFLQYTGTPITFQESALPKGNYYDAMPELSESKKFEACQILFHEAKKYPKGYLGNIGLKTVGVFAACVSKTNDGYHHFDKNFKGYLYYGLWNRETLSFAAAYYTNEQLPLTFHHEVFHHIDATFQGKTDYTNYFTKDDLRFQEAISGEKPYLKPEIKKEDILLLKKLSNQYLLKTQVSSYAQKNLGEDQAETARYFMTTLPDSILQLIEQPNLPGSQRILHILSIYENASKEGPNIFWFIDVALQRIPHKNQTTDKIVLPIKEDEIVIRLTPPKETENPYLQKVNKAISDPKKQIEIRKVQPACVRIGGGSGVNVSPKGLILTAGHVTKAVNSKLAIEFPDGKKFTGNCIAYSQYYDLAIVEISTKEPLPFAEISASPPEIGTWVACIGNPSSRSPEGEVIPGHTPFYVSVGKVVRFKLDPEKGIFGPQRIGRCIYTAWTYWGHSGSPLFNAQGKIVAIHNSWENDGRTRNGVPQQVILEFLKNNKISANIEATQNK